MKVPTMDKRVISQTAIKTMMMGLIQMGMTLNHNPIRVMMIKKLGASIPTF
jgi:hypothetical protein